MAEPSADRDQLRLTVAGQHLVGWQSIRVTRGIERCPSDFDIEVTEKYPGLPQGLVVLAGDVCRIDIGGDLLLTGYVDRYLATIDGGSHTIRIMGRSACEDLVDCSVIWEGNQLSNTSLRDAAAKLAEPYGISVRALDGDGPRITVMNIQLGETPFEVIERLARWGAMLVYDDPTGNLMLARVGQDSMGSDVREGENIEAAQVTITMDERFTEYHAYRLATDDLTDLGPNRGNEISVRRDPSLSGLKRIDGKPRVRKRAIISEQIQNDRDFADVRTQWELARRLGRARAILTTVAGWRDAKGRLWEPNTRVLLHIPSCKIDNLTAVISEVSYMRTERGTQARLTLMPPEAFTPEPTIIGPAIDTQLYREANPNSQATDGRRDRG